MVLIRRVTPRVRHDFTLSQFIARLVDLKQMIVQTGRLFLLQSREANWVNTLMLTNVKENVVGIGITHPHLTVGLPQDQVNLFL